MPPKNSDLFLFSTLSLFPQLFFTRCPRFRSLNHLRAPLVELELRFYMRLESRVASLGPAASNHLTYFPSTSSRSHCVLAAMYIWLAVSHTGGPLLKKYDGSWKCLGWKGEVSMILLLGPCGFQRLSRCTPVMIFLLLVQSSPTHANVVHSIRFYESATNCSGKNCHVVVAGTDHFGAALS
jgi:hypothetical protein